VGAAFVVVMEVHSYRDRSQTSSPWNMHLSP
jgi:hypothetical protein